MFERIKDNLLIENHELKTRINTMEAHYEMLADKRIDEIIKALVDKDRNEKLEEENMKLKIRNQQLKEVIKELVNGKKKL